MRRDGAIKNTQGERVANHVKRAAKCTEAAAAVVAALSEQGTDQGGEGETHRRDSPYPRWNSLLRSRHCWETVTPSLGLGTAPILIARPVRNGRLGGCSQTRYYRSSLPEKRMHCRVY